MIVILKNTTGSEIRVGDLLGIGIAASGQRDVTNKFSSFELSKSSDLATLVGSGDIVVNDGVDDLSSANGLKHVNPVSEYMTDQIQAEAGVSENDAIAYAIALG